jgi:pectate lyase
VSAQTTSTSDTTFTSGRFYFQRDANTPSVDADELRVGVSWAEVTPVGVPLTGVKLGFTTQPSNTSSGTTVSPVVVQVQAADSSAVASNNVPVTLTLTSGTGTLGGTLTQNTDASGKATFSNLNIDQPGTKQFTATASGIGVGLTNAVSAAFTITNVGGGGGGNNGNGPVITSIRYLPVGIVLSGTNGAPGSNYNVLATSDFTTNVSTWVPASYANFDANGNFLITNPAASILASQYYRLLTTSNTKLVPPSLTQSPQNLTVAVGQTATFTVGADGPQLSYQWFFGGTAIPGAHNATLVITNAQAGNAGNYFVIVANGAGQAASGTAVLRVGNYAPSITLQPVGETNYTGGTAIFRVAADGTQPLVYQWYKNNNSTPVSGGTNAALALAGLQLTDAGNYFVIVSGPVAPPATSSSAALVVNSAPTALPDTNMVGFAALTGVTGGLGGSNVFVGDYLSLSNYVRHIEPLIIYVTNLIPGPGPTVDQYCYVYGNNKSIIGVGTNAGLSGSDLRINATNIIVQNLYLPVPPGGTNDGITIDGGTKGTGKFVWIDHCTVSNAQDGSIDITKGADYVTISWCKFIYAPKTPSFTHELVNLIGSSDTDFVNNNPFHVTIHHCWYADNAIERMPSVRHGLVHVFNNYYTCSGNNYCVRTRIGSEVFVENNFFSGIQNPWELLTTTGATGLLRATGNNVTGPGDTSYGNTWVNGWYPGQSLIPGTDTLPNLLPIPYDYTNALHSATDAAYYVPNYAGNGKYPYVP